LGYELPIVLTNPKHQKLDITYLRFDVQLQGMQAHYSL
jgi:hypothetical protein